MKETARKERCEYPRFPIPAVGVTVVSETGKILMVKRGKPPAQGLWSVPGGTIELGETIFYAAKREVLEETGLSCKPLKVCDAIDAIYTDDKNRIQFHYVILYVLARCKEQPPKAHDDALEAGWFSLDEIERLPTPGRTYQLVKKTWETCGLGQP